MKRLAPHGNVELAGFNNLTKALSFNLYDFCAGRTERERKAYIEYIADRYNADRVTEILQGICGIIEANVLAVSKQNYDPWGASSMVLMSDIKGAEMMGSLGVGAAASMHLDKSHICAHTYPDFFNAGTICSFRIDIDIATCGEITPLKALNYMFEKFESDVVVIDYVVRGFTRDSSGQRVYIDHDISTIQDFIDDSIIQDYYCLDLALQNEKIWQTKMLRTRLDEATYFLDEVDLKHPDSVEMIQQIKKEMRGVLYSVPE